MKTLTAAPVLALTFLLAACASSQPDSRPNSTQPTTGSEPAVRIEKSRDGSYSGEVTGKPQPGSKFSRLQLGMQMSEVQELMGRTPDRFHTYESGKRWIPFYFGNDARRMQVLYKNEGCLVFTGGNIWGGAGGDLMAIDHDATGACYQP